MTPCNGPLPIISFKLYIVISSNKITDLRVSYIAYRYNVTSGILGTVVMCMQGAGAYKTSIGRYLCKPRLVIVITYSYIKIIENMTIIENKVNKQEGTCGVL